MGDIEDIGRHKCSDCACCSISVQYYQNKLAVRLREEDVTSLRKDLKSDLAGLGGSVQRAMAVQCILDTDFENAMFFATDALHKDPKCQDTLMLLANVCHLAGQYEQACQHCMKILDLAKAPATGHEKLPTNSYLGLLRSGSMLERPIQVLGGQMLAEMQAFSEAFAVHDACKSRRADRAAVLIAMADICMMTGKMEHLAKAQEYYQLTLELGHCHKAAAAAAECGLIAVRLRSQALQPNQLERSSVCGHCNQDGACIECPQCQSEVYCSKACLRKARKQHRKSCVNAANAHTRKLQFCCNKGDIDELNFQRICQRSVNVKEEWYQADIVTNCTQLCYKYSGATKLLQALFLLYHEIDKQGCQPESLELSFSLKSGIGDTQPKTIVADPTQILRNPPQGHCEAQKHVLSGTQEQSETYEGKQDAVQLCRLQSQLEEANSKVVALELKVTELTAKRVLMVKEFDSVMATRLKRSEQHQCFVADLEAQLEECRDKTRSLSVELHDALEQNSALARSKGDEVNEVNELRAEVQLLNGQSLEGLSISQLEELQERMKLGVDVVTKCLHSRHREAIDQRLCVVCQDHDRCVLLLPCRHLLLCRTCLPLVTCCPMCRMDIVDSVVAFV